MSSTVPTSANDELIRKAQRAAEGKHPEHSFPVRDGSEMAIPYALLALVQEQKATNSHLAVIANELARFAEGPVDPVETSPLRTRSARRLWPRIRRTA